MKYLTLAVLLLLACPPAFAQAPAVVPAMPLTAAAVKEKVAQLKGEDTGRRLEAIRELGKAGTAAAKKALRSALKKEKNPLIKARLVDAIAKRQDKDSAAELTALAQNDPDGDVRRAAVHALAFSKDETVVPVLMRKFTDEKELPGIRLRAADSLSYHPSDEVFGVFVKALDDADPIIRRQALVSLYNGFSSDPARVRPYLERMTNDPAAGELAKTHLKMLGISGAN